MAGIVGGLGCRAGCEEAADDRPDLVVGGRSGPGQERSEVREQLLDRVEVGQVEDRGTSRGEGMGDSSGTRRSSRPRRPPSQPTAVLEN